MPERGTDTVTNTPKGMMPDTTPSRSSPMVTLLIASSFLANSSASDTAFSDRISLFCSRSTSITLALKTLPTSSSIRPRNSWLNCEEGTNPRVVSTWTIKPPLFTSSPFTSIGFSVSIHSVNDPHLLSSAAWRSDRTIWPWSFSGCFTNTSISSPTDSLETKSEAASISLSTTIPSVLAPISTKTIRLLTSVTKPFSTSPRLGALR